MQYGQTKQLANSLRRASGFNYIHNTQRTTGQEQFGICISTFQKVFKHCLKHNNYCHNSRFYQSVAQDDNYV